MDPADPSGRSHLPVHRVQGTRAAQGIDHVVKTIEELVAPILGVSIHLDEVIAAGFRVPETLLIPEVNRGGTSRVTRSHPAESNPIGDDLQETEFAELDGYVVRSGEQCLFASRCLH